MRIGIDFDNTIAGYDHAFVDLAVEWGVLANGSATNKTQVRDALRTRDGGERDWQRLQGRVYGAEIKRAILIDGVRGFLDLARRRGDMIFIVSHKTEFGHFDRDRINLRDAARGWMGDHDFFVSDGFSIDPNNVHFLSTRTEKVAKIAELDLDWFIDDLPEVLCAEGFPSTVKKVLFTNGGAMPQISCAVRKAWEDIQTLIYT